VVFKPIAEDEWNRAQHQKQAAEVLSMSAVSFGCSSSWSEEMNGHWAAQTDSMWRQRPRNKQKLFSSDGTEKDWAKSVFSTLPRVGPRRTRASPLAKLKIAASAPDLVELPAAVRADAPQRLPKAMRRISSIESCVSTMSGGNRDQLNSRNSMSSEADNFPEIPAPQSRAANARATIVGLEMKAGNFGRRASVLGADGKQHKAPSDVADLAHRWDLPLATVTEASKLFSPSATLPGYDDEEDVLRDGYLNTDAMMNIVCRLANMSCVDDLSATPKEIMGIVDKNMDGTVDFHEFTCWYHERAFLEYMNLTKAEIETRRVGSRLGISVADMDIYKANFDRFDCNRNGAIELDEFRELVHSLMKVPAGLQIPESRVLHFWQECNRGCSGRVDLGEFVAFYVKHFNPDAPNPIEDYYKAIRRVHPT